MKKRAKKLVLAKETVKNLDGANNLENVQGGTYIYSYYGCPSFTAACTTIRERPEPAK